MVAQAGDGAGQGGAVFQMSVFLWSGLFVSGQVLGGNGFPPRRQHTAPACRHPASGSFVRIRQIGPDAFDGAGQSALNRECGGAFKLYVRFHDEPPVSLHP